MYEIKIIAFGDIHGCYQAAEAAVLLAKKEKATSIFLGDYVDRGPNSIKTLEILIKAMKDNPDWIFLRGNHDQMLLDLIFGKQIPNKEFDVYSGRTSNEETSKVFQKWSDLSEIRKEEITKFLESTVFFHEINEWIFVHSPLKNSAVKINDKLKDELIWNYDLNPTWNGKQFMHGHKVVDKPINTNQGYNINTGCGFGGYLTGTLIKLLFPDPINRPTLIRQTLINFFISETGEKLDNTP